MEGWERQAEEMRTWSETPTERWEREGWQVWRRREKWIRGVFGREWEGGGGRGELRGRDRGELIGGCGLVVLGFGFVWRVDSSRKEGGWVD